MSEVGQFNNWIQALLNQNKNQALEIVIRNLKNMGYQMNVA
jgi:hypothetical protein